MVRLATAVERTRIMNDVFSMYQVDNMIIDQYQRQQEENSNRHGWESALSYKHLFPKKDKEWSFSAELDQDNYFANADYDVSYFFPENQDPTKENNVNQGKNLEWAFQTDYTHPISEHLKIETGLKASLRNMESAFTFRGYDQDMMNWFIDPEQTDIFYYDQNVYAGYISSTSSLGEKTSLIAGIRAEATSLDGSFAFFSAPFDNTYTNWLPAITISRKLSEFNQLRVSYNQRIQRPNQRELNPFITYNDNRDISYGNPYLSPEYVHQIEIAGNFFINGNMVNISLYGRQTDDLIESLLSINEEGVSETTYENFGIRNAAGLNLFGTLSLGKKVSLQGSLDMNLWNEQGQFENQSLSNSGTDYSGRLNLSWTVTETLKTEGFAFFRSPTSTVQGKTPGWSMMSIGLKKELFNKRFSLGINITEPFRENLSFIRELSGTDFYQYTKTVRPVRSFGITFGYRFGKLDFNERDRKKDSNGIRDDEPVNDNLFRN